MPFNHTDGLRYLTFDSLNAAGVTHGVITRSGGVSPAPWAALNVGATVGDDPLNVQENRHRSFGAFGLELDTLFDVWQVHSAQVVCADKPRPPEEKHVQADAILTDRPGVTLFMRFADCTPILLFDAQKKVVGLVHAGWLGTVRRIAVAAVEAMHTCYGSRPQDVCAAIGPAIGPDHYEVGPEVAAQVREVFGPQAPRLLRPVENGGEKVYLDLWAANRLLLEAAGVGQVETAEICTACHVDDWYSHRLEQGRTGRFGALIAL